MHICKVLIPILQVIWAVGCSSATGVQNPLAFSTIITNIGKAWNSTLNKVIINAVGTYFLHVDICTCASGGSIMEVWKNNEIAFRAQSPLTFNGTTGHVRGHAAVLKLIKGDQLFVKIPATPPACIYSGYYCLTAFYGLLLFAEE